MIWRLINKWIIWLIDGTCCDRWWLKSVKNLLSPGSVWVQNGVYWLVMVSNGWQYCSLMVDLWLIAGSWQLMNNGQQWWMVCYEMIRDGLKMIDAGYGTIQPWPAEAAERTEKKLMDVDKDCRWWAIILLVVINDGWQWLIIYRSTCLHMLLDM